MLAGEISRKLGLRARIRAAAIHLAGTIFIACLSYLLVFHVWYPPPFDMLAGGRDLFGLIVGVDLILGPSLMFAIFDRAKRRPLLALDIASIVSLQLTALLYGLHVSYVARPVALVFEVDRFRVIAASEVRVQELASAPPGFRSLPKFAIWTLGTRSSNGDEVVSSVDAALQGFDLAQRPSYWQNYDFSRAEVLRRSRPLSELRAQQDPQVQQEIAVAVHKAGIQREHARFLPLTSRLHSWIAILDSLGNPVSYAAVDGF
jgi:MFS family permease